MQLKTWLSLTVIVMLLTISSTFSRSVNSESETRNYVLPRWSPEGQYLAYTSNTAIPSQQIEFWLFDADTESHTRILDIDFGSNIGYSWAPGSDELFIFYTDAELTGNILVYSLVSENAEVIYQSENRDISWVDISQNGQFMAFIEYPAEDILISEEAEVYIMDLDTKIETRLIDSPSALYSQVEWLGQNRLATIGEHGLWIDQIGFDAEREVYNISGIGELDFIDSGEIIVSVMLLPLTFDGDPEAEIYILSLINQEVNPIPLSLETYQVFSFPQWIDNNRVLFGADSNDTSEYNRDLWILDIPTTEIHNLTSEIPLMISNPDINPTTDEIAFQAADLEEQIFQIWVMNLDGSNLRQITE